MNVSSRPRTGLPRSAPLDPSPNRAGKALTPPRPKAARQPRKAWAAPERVASARTRPEKHRAKVPGAGYVLAALSLAALFLVLRLVVHHAGPQADAKPKAAPAAGPSETRLWVDPQYVGNYQSQLASYLGGLTGTYAVAVVDVQTGATIGQNEDASLTAASVNKLELVVELYRLAEQGRLNLDTTTVVAADEIQNYGTGTIQLGGPDQTFSYRDLARLMVEESDNTAAYVVGKRLGLDSIQADLPSWGLTHTSLDGNTTSASDVALLLTALARGKLLNPADTAEVLGYLEHTAWNDRLQSGVPAGVTVAHKIGTDPQVYNDAAIVSPDDHPYVVVVLSNGTQQNAALSAMADISRLVYSFESGLTSATRTITQ